MELGLDDRIELLERAVTPVAPDEALNVDNPLGKIPCLVIDDGEALYDSRVVCEYLNSLAIKMGMAADQGDRRWTWLRREALADGILDAAVGIRYETFLRPKERQWQAWIDAQTSKWRRALDQLETEAERFGEHIDIGVITVACALGYLDFRYPDEGWRDQRSSLAAWYERFSQRPSMAMTIPA